jgi:hypothetical protein
MTLAAVVVKDRRSQLHRLNRVVSYADGVPDSRLAVSLAVKEVDVGS